MQPLLRSRPARRLLQPLRARLTQLTRRVVIKQLAPLRTEVKQLRADLVQLRAELHGQWLAAVESAAAVEELRVARGQEHGGIAELTGRIEAIGPRIDNYDKLQRLAELERRETAALITSYRSSLELLLGPAGRYTSRFVSEDDLSQLIDQFGFLGGDSDVVVAVHEAYRLLVELELRGIGRFAGSTPNALAKLTAMALTPMPSGEVLEIGTLFGLGAVAAMRQLARRDIDAFITIVDPLARHQIQPEPSADLDVAVTRASRRIVEANLALGGVTSARYRLIEGLSGDSTTIEAIGDRAYGVIVIDGDHGEEATLSDLLLAEQLAADEGLVLLDDYGDPAWPGVEKALELYLRRDGARLAVVGCAATTAFLRAGQSAR